MKKISDRTGRFLARNQFARFIPAASLMERGARHCPAMAGDALASKPSDHLNATQASNLR